MQLRPPGYPTAIGPRSYCPRCPPGYPDNFGDRVLPV